MGDGIFDHYVMKEVLYSIAPSNSDENALKYSDYQTKEKAAMELLQSLSPYYGQILYSI